ncbi:class I glutamine amidotransferase-like protein [Corynespora cassiicola Philippines]|uniref:Class I glutamine amidotransferase-like protein n=1 Tax=Corynespora cassiicola Philippines TaxID=1448308 RepID=A0A2T2NT43_CORCC|nr:class I glutamine amidotransferase-like protein [Corynespora cassiicola Philippines]
MRTLSLTTVLPLLLSLASAQSSDGRPPFQNTTSIPKHYALLLTPSVDPIDIFGPLGVLTGLHMYYTNSTGRVTLSLLAPSLSHSTTNPPLPGLDFGADLVPTVTFDEYLSAHPSTGAGGANASIPPIDVLLVPGGGGTRGNVSREIAFVETIYPSLQHIISVCTGSTILARAGVLDGRKATTNKKAWAWATGFGRGVEYVGKARWVRDGNVWTGSGVSAAIDTTYAFLADVYGEEVSQWVADASEYTRWTDASFDPFAERWNVSDVATPA